MFFKKIFQLKKNFIYSNHNNHKIIYPRVKNLKFLTIEKKQDIEKYKNENYEFLLSDYNYIIKFLKKGMVGFFFVHNKKFIHENWIALNKSSGRYLDEFIQNIDWDQEVLWGGAKTHKDYRRNCIYQSSQSNIYKYLFERGINNHRFSVHYKNIAGNSSVAVFKPKIIAIGYSLKIMIIGGVGFFKWTISNKGYLSVGFRRWWWNVCLLKRHATRQSHDSLKKD